MHMVEVSLEFLRPTKTMRELFVLLCLDETEKVSQHELARRIGVSSSMANNYMKQLVGQGLVEASGDTNRTMKYAVTRKGNGRLSGLMSTYSREIARLYSIAKHEVEKRLLQLHDTGIKTVVLFGAAETGELVYAAAKNTPLNIVGWVDSDKAKQQLRFGEIRVLSPERIESFQPDAVLIASSGKADEIRRQLRHLPQKGIEVVTL
jgi:DNA-binding MarR family transcriptional regulator